MNTFAALNSLTNIRHAFFTKLGGVSTGVYDSLNCGYGSGDAPENVTRNRRIALQRLGVTDWPLVTAYQEHTADVVTVAEPWGHDDAAGCRWSGHRSSGIDSGYSVGRLRAGNAGRTRRRGSSARPMRAGGERGRAF